MYMRIAVVGDDVHQVAAILEQMQTVHEIACLSSEVAAVARRLGFTVFEFNSDSDGIAGMVEFADMMIAHDRTGATVAEVIERADEHGKPCKFMVEL